MRSLLHSFGLLGCGALCVWTEIAKCCRFLSFDTMFAFFSSHSCLFLVIVVVVFPSNIAICAQASTRGAGRRWLTYGQHRSWNETNRTKNVCVCLVARSGNGSSSNSVDFTVLGCWPSNRAGKRIMFISLHSLCTQKHQATSNQHINTIISWSYKRTARIVVTRCGNHWHTQHSLLSDGWTIR